MSPFLGKHQEERTQNIPRPWGRVKGTASQAGAHVFALPLCPFSAIVPAVRHIAWVPEPFWIHLKGLSRHRSCTCSRNWQAWVRPGAFGLQLPPTSSSAFHRPQPLPVAVPGLPFAALTRAWPSNHLCCTSTSGSSPCSYFLAGPLS